MKKLTLLIVFISFTTLAITLAMNNYLCAKCGTIIQSSSAPKSSGCPSNTTHHWSNLGEVGDKNYQCSKCGTVVKVNSAPQSSGCPKATTHSWSKL